MVRSPPILGSVPAPALIVLAVISFVFALWALNRFRRIARRIILRNNTLTERQFWLEPIASTAHAEAVIRRASWDFIAIGIIYILPVPRIDLAKAAMGAILTMLAYSARKRGITSAILLVVYMTIAFLGACLAIAMLATDGTKAVAVLIAIGIGLVLWYGLMGWVSVRLLKAALYIRRSKRADPSV